MPQALPAIAVAGVALSAATTVMSGVSQAHAASYQAAVNRNNAQTAAENAQYAREAGSVETQLAGRRAAEQEATVRAGMAANNIDVNTGSAEDVQEGERETGLLSQETVQNNAALQAYGYQTQGAGFTSQAGLLSSEAGTTVPGSLLAAGGSAASNAALIPSKFGGFSNYEPASTTYGGVTDQLPPQY
jgi:hypothetical protein